MRGFLRMLGDWKKLKALVTVMITYQEEKQTLLNEMLQKERRAKRRLCSACVFLSELYSFGVPVRLKLVFTIVYKLMNLWISKREEVFIEALAAVLPAVLSRLEERGNSV